MNSHLGPKPMAADKKTDLNSKTTVLKLYKDIVECNNANIAVSELENRFDEILHTCFKSFTIPTNDEVSSLSDLDSLLYTLHLEYRKNVRDSKVPMPDIYFENIPDSLLLIFLVKLVLGCHKIPIRYNCSRLKYWLEFCFRYDKVLHELIFNRNWKLS